MTTPTNGALPAVDLDAKYRQNTGTAYMTGIQALVRLPMMQYQRDQAAGYKTAGFISGYRGSPLGGLDQALWKARDWLGQHCITFKPGLNEDLAATAVWGTQQVGLFPGPKVDGVFSLWYGKGPGVDRSGDVLRHGNAAGSSAKGGVLLIAGDDHAAKSSTLPHQTDHVFDALMIPVLAPAGVQEFLDLGLHGWAMSRYSGCWVAMKAVSDTVESSAVVELDPFRVETRLPDDFTLPEGGLNIRWPDPPLVVEERLLHHKLYAVLAYARANQLNRIVVDCPQPRLGIITAGKSYLDVMQALDELGIDEAHAAEIGLRILKVGLTWPLEPTIIHQFAEGLEEILVVEEKRQVIEYQLKEQLYNWREAVRPRVIGKFDEKGEWTLPEGHWLLPACGELTPAMIARVIADRIGRFYTSDTIQQRLRFFSEKEAFLNRPRQTVPRLPYYCSGCPHNTSTRLPDGSLALAGIGCHYMAMWIQPGTKMFSQMGGEGVSWIGISPFSETRHIFVNLGDGTYFHSGLLAIRAAIAARQNMTYKILYNDAVAMTGGQPVDGTLTVPMITRQLEAEGVSRIIITSDEPEKYALVHDLAQGTTVHHRDELDQLQRELRETPGVTVLIHDQTCAAEKRRRRKRGKYPDPPRRVIINERVCEGCGDCSRQSNCLSVVPVDTLYGRKRQIDQSACNKDFSCLKGFCPSLVTLEGEVSPRKPLANQTPQGLDGLPPLPMPILPTLEQPYGVLVTGVGGTGVVTIGGILGMAAHLQGLGVTVLDQTGLAQKGGAVTSHIRLARHQKALHAVRIAAGDANLVLGCDLVVAATNDCLAKMRKGFTKAIINTYEAPTGDMTRNPDLAIPARPMEDAIEAAIGPGHMQLVEATRLATALLGDSIAANLFMLGYAWQAGLIPLTDSAIRQAIELNGAAIPLNLAAFEWGRHAQAHPQRVSQAAGQTNAAEALDDEALQHHFANELTAYQDDAYAQRYLQRLERVRQAEARLPGPAQLTPIVLREYYRLLAYKDEYEVARLYTQGEFAQQLANRFDGDYRLQFHFGPGWLSGKTARKVSIGPWAMPLLRLLARARGLRQTRFDPFARSADRQLEKQLLQRYEQWLDRFAVTLGEHNRQLACELAKITESVRGYGHIKLAAWEAIRDKTDQLQREYEARQTPAAAPVATGVRL